MIAGWHWRGRTALAADWRILPLSPGGEATLLWIAAPCDNRGMTTRRFSAPWRADKMPGGYVVRDANGQALVYSCRQSEKQLGADCPSVGTVRRMKAP
jgi:hypothetical protein